MTILVPLAVILVVFGGILWIGEQLLPLDLPAKPEKRRAPRAGAPDATA